MVGHSFVLFLWLSIPDTICYVCLLFFIQASDYLILLLDPYILLDIWEMSDSHLVWYFDIALVWLSNRSIFMVFCILLWAKSDGLDSMRHLHRLRKTRMRAVPHYYISDVQAGARASACCSTSLCSRWRNPSMNTRRLQSVTKNEHSINSF